MKLRLLLFSTCNRNCEGCCNKDWDLRKLPVCEDYQPYDTIMLTGGEPMLLPEIVTYVIKEIRDENPKAKIYMYTAKIDNGMDVVYVLDKLDGITVTLHTQEDVKYWIDLVCWLNSKPEYDEKSLRVNIFKGIQVPIQEIESRSTWIIKKDIEWIKNCPLPKDEVFMRW